MKPYTARIVDSSLLSVETKPSKKSLLVWLPETIVEKLIAHQSGRIRQHLLLLFLQPIHKIRFRQVHEHLFTKPAA